MFRITTYEKGQVDSGRKTCPWRSVLTLIVCVFLAIVAYVCLFKDKSVHIYKCPKCGAIIKITGTAKAKHCDHSLSISK